jgi:cytochrome P450
MAESPLVVDLGSAEFWQDPFPTWREAHRRGRTARTTTGELVLLDLDDLDVASSDAAFTVLGLDALRRLGIEDGPVYDWRRLTLAAVHGEHHDRLRSVVGRAFTPRRVERLRSDLHAHAETLIHAAIEREHFDIVSEYAAPLPMWLICRFLGLPVEIDDRLEQFLVGTELAFVEPMTPEHRARAEASISALYELVEGLIVERRADPREDLVSDLVAAEGAGRLDRDELYALVVNIIGGAIGSTRAAISNTAWLLMTHRDQARLVRDDPTMVRPAIEESLRVHPPFRGGRRRVVERTECFGLVLEAGDTVYLSRQAANRDPARWDDPDRFDIAREENRHHAFGYGPHFCLGQALARLDLHESTSVLAKHIDDLVLIDEVPRRVPFTPDDALERLEVASGRAGP